MTQPRSDLLTHGRRLLELAMILVNAVFAVGGSDQDIRRVFGNENLQRDLGLLIMGRLPIYQFPSLTYCRDLILEGWEIEEDIHPTGDRVRDLYFDCLMHSEETRLRIHQMMDRARSQNAVYGLPDAKHFLAQQGDISPGIHRRGTIIILSGTVLRDTYGKNQVPCLILRKRWELDFIRLDQQQGRSCYFPRRRR